MMWAAAADAASSQSLVVPILVAVGGGAIATLFTGLFQRPRQKAETAKLVAEQGQTIDQRWKTWAEELEGRLKDQEQSHAEQLRELRERMSDVEEKLQVSESDNARLSRENQQLRAEITRERTITRELIRWAFAMRAEIRRLGGNEVEMPRQVEDYVNELDD